MLAWMPFNGFHFFDKSLAMNTFELYKHATFRAKPVYRVAFPERAACPPHHRPPVLLPGQRHGSCR